MRTDIMISFKRIYLLAAIILCLLLQGCMANYRKMTSPIKEIHVQEGKDIKIFCTFPNFNPNVNTVEWVFQNHVLFVGTAPTQWSDYKRMRAIFTKNYYQLKIRYSKVDDTGTYSCGGADQKSLFTQSERIFYHVIVYRKKESACDSTSIDKNTEIWARPGENIQLLCTFNCPWNISSAIWTKNDNNEVITEDENVSIVSMNTSSVLHIYYLHDHNFGLYRCKSADQTRTIKLWNRKASYDITKSIKITYVSPWNRSVVRSGGEGHKNETIIGVLCSMFAAIYVLLCICTCRKAWKILHEPNSNFGSFEMVQVTDSTYSLNRDESQGSDTTI